MHKENTKKINDEWAFRNQLQNSSFLHQSLIAPFKIRIDMKHSKQYFITKSHTLAYVADKSLYGAGYTHLEVRQK